MRKWKFPVRLAALVLASVASDAAADEALASCASSPVDACAMYDTGRLTGTPRLSRIEDASGLVRRVSALQPVDILILGEAHDNPHHHRLRAALLTAPAIVMEQLRADQESGIAAFNDANARAARPAALEEFKSKVGWATGGWDKYPYDPLLTAIVATRAPLYAGDPPRATIRRIAKEGAGVLGADDRKRLALDVPLDGKLQAASTEEIESAHCGMLPRSAIPNMALAQRYRDAHLADATLRAVEAHGGAVLLTGNNHARTDRGAPWYIRARAPDKKVISVVLVEVEDGKADPEAYVPRDPDGKPAADYVVFTPPAVREDPCKAFAK